MATWSARGDSEKTSSWSIGEEWLPDFRQSIHPSIWSELDIVSGKGEADWLLWLIMGLLAEEATELETVTMDWLRQLLGRVGSAAAARSISAR